MRQEAFLSRSIAVIQLINASDDEVLEVFARLNSYTVPLNAAEIRHATYQGDFKWKVSELATQLGSFFSRYEMLSIRERLRMLDDQFTAELIGVLLEGVKDGGARNIDKLYERYDQDFPDADAVGERVLALIAHLQENFEEVLSGEVFSRPPQFLLLFAAVAHWKFGIPQGDLDELPERRPALDPARATANLEILAQAVLERAQIRLADFVSASSGTTQRINSRGVRFLYIWRALTGNL